MYGKEPECELCMPELMEANRTAVKVWQEVQGQVIFAGMDAQPIDVDITAIRFILDLYRVPAAEQQTVYQKVARVIRKMLAEKAEERKLDAMTKQPEQGP